MRLADHFGTPGLLALLLALPLFWLLFGFIDRRRERRTAQWIGPRAGKLTLETSRVRRKLIRRLALVFLAGVLLAAASPLAGRRVGRLEPRGADIVICLDVSRSMLARDLAPDRLEAARRELRALAARARNDRLALVVFAGEARLVTPLTEDEESFAAMLDLADPLSVEKGGSDLGAALAQALRALEGGGDRPGAVILLSDGGDEGASATAQAAICRERGIPVHAIGAGTEAGGKIVIETPQGESYLRDAEGREVITTLDRSTLQSLAERTGGEYVDLESRPLALLRLHEKRIEPAARLAAEAGEKKSRPNRFQWILLPALLVGILELAMTDRKRR